MASQSRTSGGVRNLRAMFENKEEAPVPLPDRGRSPAGSIGGGSNGASPQPLSTVRTSFVPVERSGAPGTRSELKKETSGELSMAAVDEKSNAIATAEMEQMSKTDLEAGSNGTAVSEAIPETTLDTHPLESERELVIEKGKGRATDLKSPSVQESADMKEQPLETSNRASDLLPNGGMNGKAKVPTTAKTVDKPAAVKTATRPTATTANKAGTASKSSSKVAKSPMEPRTPTQSSKTPVSTPKAIKAPATKSTSSALTNGAIGKEEKVIKSATKPVDTARSNAQGATPSSTGKARSQPHQAAPSSRDRPLSELITAPVKLSLSLIAPTAASLSRINGPTAVSHHTANGSVSTVGGSKTLSRSPTRASQVSGTGLRRHASTSDRSRPSLGRPSLPNLRTQTSRQSLPSKASPPDEGFLARLTRPTTSTASKVHEKVLTPPKPVITSRPSTRDGPSGHWSNDTHAGSPVSKRSIAAPKPAKTTKPPAEQSKTAVKSAAKPAKVVTNGESSKSHAAAGNTATIKSPSKNDSKPAQVEGIQPTIPQKAPMEEPVSSSAAADDKPEEIIDETQFKAPDAPVFDFPAAAEPPAAKEAAVLNSSEKEEMPHLNGETLPPVADEMVAKGVGIAI